MKALFTTGVRRSVFALALLAASTATLARPEHRGDTTTPNYGSLAYDRRIDQGKYQEGYRQPYQSGPSNMDWNNEYQRRQAEEDRQRQERMRQQHQGYSNGSYSNQHRSGYGY